MRLGPRRSCCPADVQLLQQINASEDSSSYICQEHIPGGNSGTRQETGCAAVRGTMASNVRLSSLSCLLHKLRACKDRVLAVICWILRLKLCRELKQLADTDRPDDVFRSKSNADAGLQ